AGGGTVSILGDYPTINNSGQVSVISGLTGSSDGASYALMRIEGSGTLTGIARSGQPAPGAGGGIIASLSNATINSSGQAMALANLSGTTDSSNQGFFRGDGASPLIALMRHKMPAPGGGTLEGAFGWSFSDTGAVTAKVGLSGTNVTEGMFQSDGTGIVAIARQLQTAPGAGG